MATYGITATGFVIKPLADIQADLEAAFQAQFGTGINIEPESNFGQIIGIMSERFSDIWQQLEAVYNSEYPDDATGASLDDVASITGTLRHPETFSTCSKVILIGTAGVTVPKGSSASVTNVGTRFDSDADATITALAAWGASTVYALDALVANGGNVYRCAQAGTSAGSGGPTGTGTEIIDGSCVWEYAGAGSAAAQVDFTCEDAGILPAYAGTLTTIATPVAGWATVFNPTDSTVGALEETDSALRTRREQELRGQGNAAVDAIRAQLLRVSGVTAATVLENVTDSTDANNLPPHSIECVVQGGADQDVCDAILSAKGGGIQTYGTSSGSSTDSQGTVHVINFSRPTSVDIWITVDVTKAASGFPVDGAAQIADALVAWANANLAAGVSVKTSKLYVPIEGISGIDDVTAIYIGTAADPVSSTNIPISATEIAVFDTSRIVVNAS